MSTPTSNWLWLGQRAAPPLVLAGPIVRRVDPQGASVWVATKSATDVSIDVKPGEIVSHLKNVLTTSP